MKHCSGLIVAVLFLLIVNESASSPPPQSLCGPDYGQRPCVFVPAKPGNTPACANPGSTFCEKIKDYPETVIKTLFTKYKIKDILTDETQTDFHSLKQQSYSPHVHDLYGVPGQAYNYVNPYGDYTTKGPDFYPQNNQNHFINNNHYGSQSSSNQQSHQIPYYSHANHNHHNHQEPSQSNKGSGYHYNAPHSTQSQQSNFFHTKPSNSYQDYYRSTGNRRKRFYNPGNKTNMQILQQQFIKSIAPNRTKRQSPMREQLCETKSNYINPQAALNARGNWMYIVNGVDSATQLVKTETCASQQCSNLCQLPNGYNSRCEQRYVQKRLIALDANGEKFYTDTFWFPSCCVCTLSNF